jgi:uncharacterized protein (TIGR00255 family)
MKSMTGFGSGEATVEGIKFRVEITSVNRKQTDIVINLPRDLARLDAQVRENVNAAVARGRVNVFIACESATDGANVLKIDESLARQYHEAMLSLSATLGTTLTLQGSDLLRAPGVLSLSEAEVSPETAWIGIEKALTAALKELVIARSREGEHLRKDMLERLATLKSEVAAIRELAPSVVAHYRVNLKRRLEEAGLEIDLSDERLVREIGLFADRCDISEELTRLDCHFLQYTEFLEGSEPTGRAMDFLSQELNRELNTIGSKANNAQIAQHVVNCKSELEKIREQVQNVE